jgi:hypothetical protein
MTHLAEYMLMVDQMKKTGILNAQMLTDIMAKAIKIFYSFSYNLV